MSNDRKDTLNHYVPKGYVIMPEAEWRELKGLCSGGFMVTRSVSEDRSWIFLHFLAHASGYHWRLRR